MKKTAVIGASGYIGSHLLRKYRTEFPNCVGTSFRHNQPGLHNFDLRKPDIAILQLEETDHEAVAIASAIPNINWCESHVSESYALNVEGTLNLVKQLSRTGIKTIFFSSDYVFDGNSKEKYIDSEETNSITEYGKQKTIVEKEIPNLTGNYLICRLSKIYGTTWKDNTLIDCAADELLRGKTILAAHDQFFSPTHVDDVVRMLLYAQEVNANGVVHLCNSFSYSRFQILSRLAERLQVSPYLVKSVPLHSIPSMEKRPLNTSLQSSNIFTELQLSLISMEHAIETVAFNWASMAI